jgi:alanine dehydrogenase
MENRDAVLTGLGATGLEALRLPTSPSSAVDHRGRRGCHRGVVRRRRRVYLRVAEGDVVALSKCSTIRGHVVHIMKAIATSTGLAATRACADVDASASPMLVVRDVTTGATMAGIEAAAPRQLDTSATTASATLRLAGPRRQVLGSSVSDRQADSQIACVVAVCAVQKITIYTPAAEARVKFAARIAECSGIATSAAGTVSAALDHADVIVTATRATEPFVTAAMLAERTHIKAIGATTPDRIELHRGVVACARRVVADEVPTALELAPRESSPTSAPHVLSLFYVLGNHSGFEADSLTIFKPIGSSVSDLALAELILERASDALPSRRLVPNTGLEPKIWGGAVSDLGEADGWRVPGFQTNGLTS